MGARLDEFGVEEGVIRQEYLPASYECGDPFQGGEVSVDGGQVPVGRGCLARPCLPDDRERIGGHERIDIDVVCDIRIRMGDIHPGG